MLTKYKYYIKIHVFKLLKKSHKTFENIHNKMIKFHILNIHLIIETYNLLTYKN